jgi:hypothetical protein
VLILSGSAGLSSSSRTAAVSIDMPVKKFFLEFLSPRWGFVFFGFAFPLRLVVELGAAGTFRGE